MKALHRNRLTRLIAVLVFLLGVLTVSLTTLPENASASCGHEYYWVYYDDSGNVIGECWGYCGGPAGCWGSWSENRQGYSVDCPCIP